MATFIHGLSVRGSQSVYLTLTAAVELPVNGTHLILQPRTKAIYYTIDGTTPTAGVTSTAFYLAADDSDIVPIPEGLDSVRIVEAEASASLTYCWLTAKGR
jgi:hypothetical protein